MDVREKLVELLDNFNVVDDWYTNGEIADHLITHGVTVQDNTEITDEHLKQFRNAPLTVLHEEPTIEVVQEWISVNDRLPKYTEEEMERYRFFGDTFFPEFNVIILGAIKPTTLYYDGERWYDEENRCYCVTHWRCLPQPPKGE